jgi:lipopolysaccharide transport system ATP-binding protein
MSIIEINNLTKEFKLGQLKSLKHTVLNALDHLRGREVEKPKRFKALDDVSFKVEPGEVLGIIGQNGAGKSTLLKMLARISTPTSGEVKVHGSVAPLIEVGAGLIGDLTGRENIFLNGSILGLSRAGIKRKFDEIVAFAELEEFIDTPIKRYSSGMAVRLGFSIATSMDADILIVDEVLAVGDLAFQRKCFDRMEDMIRRQGKTVLLVSHNIRQVERLCSRVILMDHGKVVLDGAAGEICNAFYEQSDKKIKVQTAAGTSSIRSTGEADILDFFFTDAAGRRTDIVEFGGDFKVVWRIRANKPLKNPIFVFGVHTTDFVYVTTTTSPPEIRATTLAAGTHELSFSIELFPLLPGAYSTRLSIDVEEPVKNIFYGENIFQFSVLGDKIQRTSPQCEGFFLLDTRWDAPRLVAKEASFANLAYRE